MKYNPDIFDTIATELMVQFSVSAQLTDTVQNQAFRAMRLNANVFRWDEEDILSGEQDDIAIQFLNRLERQLSKGINGYMMDPRIIEIMEEYTHQSWPLLEHKAHS